MKSSLKATSIVFLSVIAGMWAPWIAYSAGILTSGAVTSVAGKQGAVTLACSDLTNSATSCSTDTTNAGNISSGTLAVAHGGTGTTTSTGSGSVVLSTSPTLVTPALGAATATSVNNVQITAKASPTVLNLQNGTTFSTGNTISLDGNGSGTANLGSGGTVAYLSNNLGAFAATTSAQLASVISDEIGTGNLVYNTNTTLNTTVKLHAATDSNIYFQDRSGVPEFIGITDNLSTVTALRIVGSPIRLLTSAGAEVLDVNTSGISVTGSVSSTTTGAMPVYNTSGTGQNAPHMVSGSCTLSSGNCTVTLSGSSVYTSTNSYVCSGNDTAGSALAVSSQNQSASSVKFFGTVTDAITFFCVGN